MKNPSQPLTTIPIDGWVTHGFPTTLRDLYDLDELTLVDLLKAYGFLVDGDFDARGYILGKNSTGKGVFKTLIGSYKVPRVWGPGEISPRLLLKHLLGEISPTRWYYWLASISPRIS